MFVYTSRVQRCSNSGDRGAQWTLVNHSTVSLCDFFLDWKCVPQTPLYEKLIPQLGVAGWMGGYGNFKEPDGRSSGHWGTTLKGTGELARSLFSLSVLSHHGPKATKQISHGQQPLKLWDNINLCFS